MTIQLNKRAFNSWRRTTRSMFQREYELGGIFDRATARMRRIDPDATEALKLFNSMYKK